MSGSFSLFSDRLLALLLFPAAILAPAAALSSGAPPIPLVRFGDIDARIGGASADPAGGGVWRGFHHEESLLTLVRAQQWKRPAGKSCAVYLRGIQSVPDGHVIPGALELLHQSLPLDKLPDLPPWEPFRKDDLEAIQDCKKFPCQVKLTERENRQLRTTSKPLRKKMWQSIAIGRGERYRKIGVPEGYEADGLPVEPWARLEQEGFRPALARGASIELLMRMLHFGDGRVRPIRQILDRRHSVSPRSAVMWGRAVYSDHYLDSWGEIVWLDCPTESAPLRIVHGLVVDLDLLKKGGIFARLTRGRARDAFQGQAQKYLDDVASYIQAK